MTVQRLGFAKQCPADPEAVATTLASKADGGIKVVLMSHVDTTSSVRNDVAAVHGVC
ncbi:hypothetical protein [Mesorhizobium sp. CAU 1741]|uniref:hypothetical protein n=1 Tax=Mesorhizobium sp. CAU 1741 TaxID=3140366 RepID=UPI00325AE4C4